MKQEKKKLPNSYNKIFPFLLLIATMFMGIGYAAVNSITADITGIIAANTQEGIFITDVSQSTNSTDSKINTYHQKMLSTRVVLDADDSDSYVIYNVTVYNSTDDNYVLTGVNFDELFYIDDNDNYNTDIVFELTREGELLLPHESFTFQITFKYNNDNPVQNVLNSYISFVFEKAYSVTYININNSSYPTFAIENDTLVVDMSDASYSSVIVKIADAQITNYTYENKILTIPNVTGNVSIEGTIGKYIVTFDTNMNLSQFVSTIGFTIEEQTEADGNYYRASFNKTTGTTDEWYRIVFPSYSYNVGSTYRIRMKTRVQSAVLDYVEFRHAAIDNDWGTDGREYIQFTTDEFGVWNEQILTRTFNSATTWQGGVEYQLSPRVEIYTSNLTLAGGIASRSVTFDYKDVYVGEISTVELDYGSQLGTLPTPTRDGYVFKGWYTEPEGGTKISSSTLVTEDNVIYYAQWISADETIYSVTYTNIENNDYPTFVVENETLVVDMSDTSYNSVVVKINDNQITDYTYENNILTIPNVTGNVTIEGIQVTPASYFVFDEPTNTIIGLTDAGYDQELIIPSEINGVKVEAIGEGAFSYSNITRVVIPEGVTTIGNDAFRDCYNVTEYVIPNTVTTIGDNAFREASSITELVIPDSVVTIGSWAFAGAANLETITIGRSVTSIGTASLSYDPKLTTVYYRATGLEIPADRWGARAEATFVIQ